MAPAAADVVRNGPSAAQISTFAPASAKTTAVVKPETPAPRTVTLMLFTMTLD
jgi:hypothetical protein